jgi:two-component system, OmpR family, phosphate regulon sensor histidine kinase PhoR
VTELNLAESAFETLLGRGEGDPILLLVDHRLRILRAGPQVAELADRDPRDLTGLSLIAAFGSAALDAVARGAATSRAAASGEAQLGQLGQRTFQVDAVPLGDAALVLALHDITALRRIERVRRDFVANISHELRTPLTSIKLLAETLSAAAPDDPQTFRDFVDKIAAEADHLAQLVDELLDLTMIESGEVSLAIESVDPAELVSDVGERIGPVAERRRIRISVLPGGADPEARAAADPARLGQALLNLAHNAVKYSHPGGEVRIGWQLAGDRIRFEVADDGIGVPATHQARIFERFYKVDRSRTRDDADQGPVTGSAGLGLAIVRHIAEAHGGSAGVRSVEGVGSTFWVELPRAA